MIVRHFSRQHDCAFAVIAMLWAAAMVYLSSANPVIPLNDNFVFIRRAVTLSFGNLNSLVDGLYPLGYPLLLKALGELFQDYALAGRILSLTAGLSVLLLVYLIARRLTGAPVALLAACLLAVQGFFVAHSAFAGTDMVGTAYILLGVYSVLRGVSQEEPDGSGQTAWRWFFLAGLAFGFSYLMRYTAIVMIPAVLIWLVIFFDPRTPAALRRLKPPLLQESIFLPRNPSLLMSPASSVS